MKLLQEPATKILGKIMDINILLFGIFLAGSLLLDFILIPLLLFGVEIPQDIQDIIIYANLIMVTLLASFLCFLAVTFLFGMVDTTTEKLSSLKGGLKKMRGKLKNKDSNAT